jgi:hypothetical protein
MDLQHLMGREPLAAEQGQQLLVLGEGLGVAAGILITRAFGIRNLKDLESVDTAVSAFAWERSRYRDLEGMALTELDLREVAAAPAFTAINA